MWYRRRRGGIFGFPFMLFIIALFVFHSWFGFMIGLGIFIIVGLLIRAAMFGTGGGRYGVPWGQRPYQQTQQPYDQYYQPYQPPYQPYEQGYQPPAPTYQEPQYQAPKPQYDEQPQAQYPQELPPMEQ